MARTRRVLSSALFAGGVLLVLGGLVAAQGFTPGGTLASIAAVVALLYAGAVWLRDAPPAPLLPVAHQPILFDPAGTVLTGSGAGQPIGATYPDLLRREIERRCASALAGVSERFTCIQNGRTVVFDVLPVRNAAGTVVYGLLIAAEAPAEAAETRVVAWSAAGR